MPSWVNWLAALMIVGGEALNFALGSPLTCACGYVKLWHGIAHSDETSQHLTDWYTPSHIIHGILLYAATWLIAHRLAIGSRMLLALAAEVAWEVAENTPWLIERYGTVTVSSEYAGDSILNSSVDVFAMVLGFYLARRTPIWASVVTVAGLELAIGYLIRDNLSLNVLTCSPRCPRS